MLTFVKFISAFVYLCTMLMTFIPSSGFGQGSHFAAISPDAHWVAMEDEQGKGIIVKTVDNATMLRNLPRDGTIMPYAVAAPWGLKGQQLLMIDSHNNRSTLFLIDPKRQTTKRIAIPGIAVGAPASISPDERYISIGFAVRRAVQSSLMIYDTQSKNLDSNLLIPFRQDVNSTTWVDSTHILVLTGGSDLGIHKSHFHQELFLVDVIYGKSRPLALCSSDLISEMSPYADAKGNVPVLLHRGAQYELALLNPETGKFTIISVLPLTDEKWFLLWSNHDRIYIWRYARPLGTEILTYDLTHNSLGTITRIALNGYLSADKSGSLWGWEDDKLVKLPHLNQP